MLDKFPGAPYMIGSIVLIMPSIFFFGNTNGLVQAVLIISSIGALVLGMKGAKISRENLREQQSNQKK